jgi:hypothetical protein
MRLSLHQLWNGTPAPAGAGGPVHIDLSATRLALSWDLALPSPVRIPPSKPGFTDGLWDFDVLELFLRPAADPARYLELEFGPGGHWLALAFSGVRRRSAEIRGLGPALHNDLTGTRWHGRAELPLSGLEPHAGPPPWTGLLTAVLGNGAGRLHLAWPRLPGERPDFHQPAAWAPLPGS